MYHFTVTDLRETFLSGFHESEEVCVCVCVCETARGEKGKNVNYLQHVYYIELDVETLEMNMTRSLF